MRTSFNLSNFQDEDDRAIFDLIKGSPETSALALSDHLDRTKIDVTAVLDE